MKRETFEMLSRLESLGFTREDAEALRRISMTLQRWHELECGTESDSGASISVERDETTGKPFERIQRMTRTGWVDRRYPIPDREAGALKRLAAIMARVNGHREWCATQAPLGRKDIAEHGPCNCGKSERGTLTAYVQGDPRGAALYILRPGDVPDGKDADAYYSRGIAVFK